ncbi:MAG: methyltransferase domain-containing protein [Coriobacteriia bacterium]|nr:methyltransferase domain-containing protein [Coriobacteriia bacterium]
MGDTVYRESKLAHTLCRGRGLEIGASAHNPFGLDALNVDITMEYTCFKEAELRAAGSVCAVDIVAPGDDIPVADGSQDFVISSHVLEHLLDPIGALLEWDRVVRVGGTIFMIVPHKERTFDASMPRTTLSHVVADYEATAPEDHAVSLLGHQHFWLTDDVVEMIDWIRAYTGVSWSWLAVRDVDDKVGNGFIVAVRKKANRVLPGEVSASYTRPLRQKDRHECGDFPRLSGWRRDRWHVALRDPGLFVGNVRRDWRFILRRRVPSVPRAYMRLVARAFAARGTLRYRCIADKRGAMRSEALRIALIYICPVERDQQLERGVRRFIRTYTTHRPEIEHSLHIVFNGPSATDADHALFEGIADEFHSHDNKGWDIGAFLRTTRDIDCDMVACFGTYTYFTRSGWLERMSQVFEEHGDGLYGASASYEVTPHIRTAGFWCDPELLMSYPLRIRTYRDRYEFEHGGLSITRLAEHLGLGRWLVTWDGVYAQERWREPPDIYRRGDQSNALFFDRSFDMYEAFDPVLKAEYAALADGVAPGLDEAERASRLRACLDALGADIIRDRG